VAVPAQTPTDLKTVDVGKVDVEYHQIGWFRLHGPEGVKTGLFGTDLITRKAQGASHKIGKRVFIVDDE
jgi:hypothetical protein